MDTDAEATGIIELLGDTCVAGGSDESYIKNAVQAYLEVREDNEKDQMKATWLSLGYAKPV